MKPFLSLSEKVIIITVFIILSLLLLLNHEPWRDEAQAWLIARDSPNIGSVIHLMGYEGTPALWHLILFPLAHWGLPYFSMAVVHFLIILSAVIIFLNYAPFSKLQKVLFVFGYYIFYEYNIIARNYALSVLCLFLIAVLYEKRFMKPILYSTLISILSNSNVHSLVIALVLGGFYFAELFLQKDMAYKNVSHIMSCFIILLGIIVAIYQLSPPMDLMPSLSSWNFEFGGLIRILIAVVGAFLPILRPDINFWNIIFPRYRYLAVPALVAFLLSLGFFLKKPKPMLIYLISAVGLFSIFSFKYLGSLRHHGLIFMIFIFSLWIAKDYNKRLLINNKIYRIRNLNLNYFLTSLLFLHVLSSPIAFYYELNYDFSAGKRTAAFLKGNGFINDDTFIATYKSYAASAILPYVPKPHSQFYYVEYDNYRSFMIWNKRYFLNANLSIDEIIDRVDKATLDKDYNTVLLILNKEVKDEEKFFDKYNLIASFKKTIVLDESFYIYQRK